MSINRTKKGGRKSVLLSFLTHTSCVPRRNCTIILELYKLPIKYYFAVRYSATFYLLSTHSPLFNCTRIILRATHTSFHEVQLLYAFFESKSQMTAITTTTLPPTSREYFDRKTRLKGTGKLPRLTAFVCLYYLTGGAGRRWVGPI